MYRIGITEMHGIAKEYAAHPPEGFEYTEIYSNNNFRSKLITSTAKGVFDHFSGEGVDLIEAPLFPILTPKKWIYTPADYPTCGNFSFSGLPLPRKVRIKFLEHIFLKPNFKKLIFKSNFGKNTLYSYGGVTNDDLLRKVDVIYPAVRRVDDRLIKYNKKRVNITFVGDFLGKGGTHVVDVFENLQNKYSNITLNICASDNFKTNNHSLSEKYLNKIKNNDKIIFGFVDRSDLLNEVLPNTDIFVCPTYRESYGYAIEEATAYGIPVISTRHGAIPEIIIHGKTGFLIDTEQFSFISNFKSYIVDSIPDAFNQHMNNYLNEYLVALIENYDLRVKMGRESLMRTRDVFSFDKRNNLMLNIYKDALS